MSQQVTQLGRAAWAAVHEHGAFRRDFPDEEYYEAVGTAVLAVFEKAHASTDEREALDPLEGFLNIDGLCAVRYGVGGVVAEEPEGEHVFIERYGMHHAKFGGLGGDVTSLTITREAWKSLGEPDVLAVSVSPVEQGNDQTTNHEIGSRDA